VWRAVRGEEQVKPVERKKILGSGMLGVLLLAMGALSGRERLLHGRHWMTRANGSFQFFHWGLASLAGALFLTLWAWLTSPAFARFADRRPSRARWVREVVRGVLWALALAAIVLLIIMPVA
jgi:hypothetical protein